MRSTAGLRQDSIRDVEVQNNNAKSPAYVTGHVLLGKDRRIYKSYGFTIVWTGSNFLKYHFIPSFFHFT